jgi:hypothetical protein
MVQDEDFLASVEVLIRNNLLEQIERTGFMIFAGADDVEMDHNTFVPLKFKFIGNRFEFWVNGKLVVQGERDQSETVRLTFSSGDGWSPGTCIFSDFRLSAPR